MYIFCGLGLASRHWRQLTSNVRHRIAAVVKLVPFLLALVAAPLAAGPLRPSCEEITDFAADPRAAAPSPHFRDFAVNRADLCAILTTYHEVTEAQWRHTYHHVAFADRTGTVVLRDGALLKWLVRPGGLATVTHPNGMVLFLAREKQP